MLLNWIKLASNPFGLDHSTGRAADRYSEGANSNPARVNIFQLTSAVSDYHEKFLFKATNSSHQFYAVVVGLCGTCISCPYQSDTVHH